MNKEDVIRRAREAGIKSPDFFKLTTSHMMIETLERFAALVAEREREECARICDRFQTREMQPAECAGAIRARGQA